MGKAWVGLVQFCAHSSDFWGKCLYKPFNCFRSPSLNLCTQWDGATGKSRERAKFRGRKPLLSCPNQDLSFSGNISPYDQFLTRLLLYPHLRFTTWYVMETVKERGSEAGRQAGRWWQLTKYWKDQAPISLHVFFQIATNLCNSFQTYCSVLLVWYDDECRSRHKKKVMEEGYIRNIIRRGHSVRKTNLSDTQCCSDILTPLKCIP